MTDEQHLPDGWAWTTLGEVAAINPRLDTSMLSDEIPVSFVPMAAVEAGTGQMNASEMRPLKDVRRGYTSFLEGDVLFAKITPCMENGKCAVAHTLASGIGFGSTEFHVLRLPGDIEAQFLYYYISQESFRQSARAKMTGTAGQLRVPTSYLETTYFPFAPFAEQRRIVAAIEQQFTRLDAGVAALKRAQVALKRYRAAVLKAAVEGSLTADWRNAHPAAEPAETLLARILAERRARWDADLRAKGKDPAKATYAEPKAPDIASLPSLPDGWAWASIEHVTECLDARRIPVNKTERANRLGSILYYGANGQVGWIDDYLFDEPLVLVVEDETFTGRELPFAYKIVGKSWVNNHAHILRPLSGLGVDFLNYSLAYYPFTPLTTGSTGRRKLTQAALMQAPYALPPLAEQEQIVAEVERRLSVVGELEATIAANLKRAERLRQSILREAFAGRLVPQDATDEPAGVLLARIQAERAERAAAHHGRNGHNGHQRRNGSVATETETEAAKSIPAGAQQQVLWRDE